MIPLRLILDTNIVVSAALKPDGLQRTVLLLATTKPARLYVSEPILVEFTECSRAGSSKSVRAFDSNYFS
jgi:predicted nucleic acid-binding protein